MRTLAVPEDLLQTLIGYGANECERANSFLYRTSVETNLKQARALLAAPGVGHPDKARMDWLEEHGDITNLRFQRGYPTMDNSSPPHWRFWSTAEGSTTRPTAREALDAAMQTPGPER